MKLTKVQCGGERPSCRQCSKKRLLCVYDTNEGETVSLAHKRKFNTLRLENSQFKELFGALHNRRENEAQEIFRRLRTSNEPLEVLEAIKQADMLLPIHRRMNATIEKEVLIQE